jgi:DNA-binding transcriptional MocR family regulator
MVVPKQLIKPIEIMLKHSHRFVAPSIQYVLNQFIEKRYLQNHFVNLIETVSAREDFFRQTFKSVFNTNDLEIMPQKVLGLQSLIKINSSSLDEQTIIACLAQNQISVHSLQACSLTKTKNKGLLMGHSSVSKTIIKNKLIRMRQLILEASEKNA